MKMIPLCFSFLLIISGLKAHSQTSFQVEKTGEGQPVLLFPGFASTPEVFREVTAVLSQDYELHAFTFAGFGDVPAIEAPWLSSIKEEIERYVLENNLKDPIIIGHSMGGTLGLWLASESPVYSQLLIIDALPAMGALFIPDYDSSTITYDNPYNRQLLAMDEQSFLTMAEQMAAGMTADTTKHKKLTDWMVESDRKTFVYGYTDLLKLDLRERLNSIKTPVTLLMATQPYGRNAAEENIRKQYKNLEKYELIFAEGAAHYIMFDQPVWFRDQIKRILSINED